MGDDKELAALVEGVRRGDRRAFMAVVGLYQQKVFVLAYSVLRDREDALDIVQETFLRLYRKIDSYRPGNNFQAWLLRIAKNLCIDHYRKNYARRREWEVPGGLDENQVASPADTADSSASDWREILSRGVGALAPQQKMVFIMRHYNELPYKDISAALKISIGTVKSLHFKAVRNLRKKLGPYAGGAP
ncbi:MAG TPA: RNA polymerase sigma factor [Candidatus Aminicenantes bacterium]|nr:RNA polymerase sigma factor [Candidatus Aminicenantes bacterium]